MDLFHITVLGVHWRDWCWSWNSNTLATWCGDLTHLKRPWCWERLRARREGDDRGWDGWMASLTQWTWVWVDSRSWWWTGRPGVLWFMRLRRVGHDWATELTDWLHYWWDHKVEELLRKMFDSFFKRWKFTTWPDNHTPGHLFQTWKRKFIQKPT